MKNMLSYFSLNKDNTKCRHILFHSYILTILFTK